MRNESHRLHQPIAAAGVDRRIGDLDDLHVLGAGVEVDEAHLGTPHAGRPECEAEKRHDDEASQPLHAACRSTAGGKCGSIALSVSAVGFQLSLSQPRSVLR